MTRNYSQRRSSIERHVLLGMLGNPWRYLEDRLHIDTHPSLDYLLPQQSQNQKPFPQQSDTLITEIKSTMHNNCSMAQKAMKDNYEKELSLFLAEIGDSPS